MALADLLLRGAGALGQRFAATQQPQAPTTPNPLQTAFTNALVNPNMPIEAGFQTPSAKVNADFQRQARIQNQLAAGRAAIIERARLQGRQVDIDPNTGAPIISGPVTQQLVNGQLVGVRPSGLLESQVMTTPTGQRFVFDREGRVVGTSAPVSMLSDRPDLSNADRFGNAAMLPMDAVDRAAFNQGQGTVAEQRRLSPAIQQAFQQALRGSMAAPAAPVAAAAPAMASPAVAAPTPVAPRPAAPPPAPVARATPPPAPVEFTPQQVMDPESAALEQAAAAILEQEKSRPIQMAADAQTREFIRTRAARIADLQKATIAKDPAKIQAALDSLRMLKEPVRRQPRTVTPEPAALPPGSEGYEMSQLLGARQMTSQELNRLTPRQYDELVRQDKSFLERSEANYEGMRQARENFPYLKALNYDDERREYEKLSRLNPVLYPPSPYDETGSRPYLATMKRPAPIR